jgi:hypothetical protein
MKVDPQTLLCVNAHGIRTQYLQGRAKEHSPCLCFHMPRNMAKSLSADPDEIVDI